MRIYYNSINGQKARLLSKSNNTSGKSGAISKKKPAFAGFSG
jgi:hypothetical protein